MSKLNPEEGAKEIRLIAESKSCCGLVCRLCYLVDRREGFSEL